MGITSTLTIAPRRTMPREYVLLRYILILTALAVAFAFITPNLQLELEGTVMIGFLVLLAACGIGAIVTMLVGFIQKRD